MRKITIDNYQDYKPSELVASFADDVEHIMRSGMAMNMSTYALVPSDTKLMDGKTCVPCLGGYAAAGMGTGPFSGAGQIIAKLGDAIRNNHISVVTEQLDWLYDKPYINQYVICKEYWKQYNVRTKKIERIVGIVRDPEGFKLLINQINFYVDVLEAAKY